MNLDKLLHNVSVKSIIGKIDNLNISEVHFDSRKVSKGDLFVAINGTQVNGHDFIAKATKQGAVAIILESLPQDLSDDMCYILVADSSYSLSIIAENYYDSPSKKIKLIGVTGTNGKTTIVTLLYNLFSNMGYLAGMLSTIENKIGKRTIKSTHTTPDAISINKMIAEMIEEGCEYCFMEVSSHSLDQNRVSRLKFDGAVFTNISHEHLDYHNSFKEYIYTKKKLFDSLDYSSFAITNSDDKNGNIMLLNTKAKRITYAIRSISDYQCKILDSNIDYTHLSFNNKEIHINLIGEFNSYNFLAIYAVAHQLGINEDKALVNISQLHSADGRFQTIRNLENVTGIVDYAHTPDAYTNVLSTINKIRDNNANLIVVFGCGGDRDKEKRSDMTSIAVNMSDHVIITSDNPRSENIDDIISDMTRSLNSNDKDKTIVIPDRKEAIKMSTQLARSGDIIVLLGKGHEKYQEVDGVKYPFDDMEILKKYINKNKK